MKTAVEWLEKIRQGQKVQPFDDYEWEIAFNHAKEMEKEQIIEAWNIRAKIDGVLTYTDNRTAEQYYNETYESNT
jgi:hypothetical protein